MKKKRLLIVSLLVLSIALSILAIYQNRKVIERNVVRLIAWELDREREKDVGDYNVLRWQNGIFQINHNSSGSKLELIKDELSVVLLQNISRYKIKNDKLYIISEDGMAVITKNNIAKICIIKYDEFYDKPYILERDGNKILYSKIYEDEHIQYLSEFNEYSDEEQKIFNKLKK